MKSLYSEITRPHLGIFSHYDIDRLFKDGLNKNSYGIIIYFIYIHKSTYLNKGD